jgi:hypothetical protein
MLARSAPEGPRASAARRLGWARLAMAANGVRRSLTIPEISWPTAASLLRAEELLAHGPLVKQLHRHADLVGQMLRQRLFIAAENAGAVALLHLQNAQYLALR